MKEVLEKYFQKTKQIIKTPKEFFKKEKPAKSFKDDLKYLLFLSVISSALILIFDFVLGYIVPTLSGQGQGPLNFAVVVYAFGVSVMGAFLSTLIFGVILHIIAKVFKGNGSFKTTLSLAIYSSSANLLMGWIPVVGVIASIYTLYILYIGGAEYHDMPSRRALIAFVIVPIVLTVLLGIVGALTVPISE